MFSTVSHLVQDALNNPGTILVLKFLYYSSPLWITIILVATFWHIWMTYIRARFFAEQSYTLLEIKLPKEVLKSPASMEFLYNALYQTGGEGGWKFKWKQWPPKIESDTYWKGSVRPWFSFEICAIDGKLHFFIWTRSSFKNVIEAQLYSQFAGIEVYEVPDYTLPVTYDPAVNALWASEFELIKPDPFPIKTYIDYKLDKDPKEEFKVDPLTPLVEYMASLGTGHNAWLQIVATAHKAEDYNPEKGKFEDKKWALGAEEEIKKIIEKAKPAKPADGSVAQTAPRATTEGEKEIIYAIERSVSKLGFDVGIRAIYFAQKDIFSKTNNAGIVAGMRHFNSNNLNGFKTSKPILKDKDKVEALFKYKNRGFFYNEFKSPKFVLNTEELATIFHFPGGISTTPTFERVNSKKAEAPSNLPV